MYFVAPPNTDAFNFFSAANITDTTQLVAVASLITDLKNYNIWNKMKAIYPMVGQAGVSSSFEVNLKNPNTFRGSFSGSWIFSSTGATPDGTSAYMDTSLNANTSLNINSSQISYYRNTYGSTEGVLIGINDLSLLDSIFSVGYNSTVSLKWLSFKKKSII